MANRKTAKKHARQRLKSRQGIVCPREFNSRVEEVLNYGTRVIDLEEGTLKNLMFAKYKSNTQRKKVYIYQDYAYIFNAERELITSYKLELR